MGGDFHIVCAIPWSLNGADRLFLFIINMTMLMAIQSHKKLTCAIFFQWNLSRPFYSNPVSSPQLPVSNECNVLAGEKSF